MVLKLPPDFKEFLRLLNDRKVEYLVVGGYAVAYHGYPRATGDLDIWVALHPKNAERIVEALRIFGFDKPGLGKEAFLQEGQVIRMGVPPVRIELLTSISGVKFEDCYTSRILAHLDDVDVPLLDLSHLKANKKAAGRHKDLNDLENLPS